LRHAFRAASVLGGDSYATRTVSLTTMPDLTVLYTDMVADLAFMLVIVT
jgi:hypothetical protein